MTTSTELRGYFNEAREQINAACQCAKVGVEFAAGRLRGMYLSAETLIELKRELQGFNAKRGKWIS